MCMSSLRPTEKGGSPWSRPRSRCITHLSTDDDPMRLARTRRRDPRILSSTTTEKRDYPMRRCGGRCGKVVLTSPFICAYDPAHPRGKIRATAAKPAYNPVVGCKVRVRLVPSSNRVPPAGPQEEAMLLHTSLPTGVCLHPPKSSIRRPPMRLGIRLGLFAVFAATVLLICADARAQGGPNVPGYITLPSGSSIYNFIFPAISGNNTPAYQLCVGYNGAGSCDIADVQVPQNVDLEPFTAFTVSADGPGVLFNTVTKAVYVEFTSYFWEATPIYAILGLCNRTVPHRILGGSRNSLLFTRKILQFRRLRERSAPCVVSAPVSFLLSPHCC